MGISSEQKSIKNLFESYSTFEIPRFQRGYAWEVDSVREFIEDLEICLDVSNEMYSDSEELNKETYQHFFGGIVAIKKPESTPKNVYLEIIDGQQRLATFAILVRVVISQLEEIKNELRDLNYEPSGFNLINDLNKMIQNLTKIYISHDKDTDGGNTKIPKLRLSTADNDFFCELMNNGKPPKEDRGSHNRIFDAWSMINSFIKNLLDEIPNAEQKYITLQRLTESVMNEYCIVIVMCTNDNSEAYNLFDVLNNRGMQLTDGDLLRSKTLEELKSPRFNILHETLANHWDNILQYSPENIDSYLRWYFSSRNGIRPKNNSFTNQYIEQIFHIDKKTIVTKKEDAERIVAEAKVIETEFEILDLIGNCKWPFDIQNSSATEWERSRLKMLVKELKHTNAMPLLLAVHKLGEKKFSKTISILEKFVFRYKTIGQVHIGKMTDIYHEHAVKIRKSIQDNERYDINTLFTALRELTLTSVPDDVFRLNLERLKYKKSKGNVSIRYLLASVEDHWNVYKKNRKLDRVQVNDFQHTTIEHIYAQSPSNNSTDHDLEELKNDLGNLTILSPNDNRKASNKSFTEKKTDFKASEFSMNIDLSKNMTWNKNKLKTRQKDLIERALDIFNPNNWR